MTQNKNIKIFEAGMWRLIICLEDRIQMNEEQRTKKPFVWDPLLLTCLAKLI